MAFRRIFERFSEPAPSLEGRPWDDVRAEFQAWAEKVVSILDSLSRVSVDETVIITLPGGGGGAPPPIVISPDPNELGFTSRRPLAHAHQPADVLGLAADRGVVLAGQTFARSVPPRSDEVVGLLGDAHVILAGQVFGP